MPATEGNIFLAKVLNHSTLLYRYLCCCRLQDGCYGFALPVCRVHYQMGKYNWAECGFEREGGLGAENGFGEVVGGGWGGFGGGG